MARNDSNGRPAIRYWMQLTTTGSRNNKAMEKKGPDTNEKKRAKFVHEEVWGKSPDAVAYGEYCPLCNSRINEFGCVLVARAATDEEERALVGREVRCSSLMPRIVCSRSHR